MLVNIRETLERVVEVDSIEDAKDRWNGGTISLDCNDFKEVEFTEYESN